MPRRRTRNYPAFQRRLREARRRADMTQAEAAQRMGWPQSYISKCESGERRVDAVELRDLARVYGVPVSFFYEW